MPETTTPADLRRWMFGLLILLAAGIGAGRIASVQRTYEPAQHRDETKPDDRRPLWPKTRPRPMPTFSSNDRSRWATIRNLVDEGTYVIGRRDPKVVTISSIAPLAALDPISAACISHAAYHTRIRANTGIIFEDGWESVDKVMNPNTLEFYSSKPPLLSTLLAGLYWLLQKLTGWTLSGEPAEVVRVSLALVNLLPFLLYLGMVAKLAETWGKTDWGRLFVVVAGGFGTLVSPFLITLNNHNFAVVGVMIAWMATMRVWQTIDRPAWRHFVVAGLACGFAVSNELPSLAFAAAVFGLLLWWSPGKTLFLFVPAAMVFAAGFYATNYAAIGQLRPAYAEFGGPWYEYEGSHWRKPPVGTTKHGIDWAHLRESRATYALHVLVGHHGLFSLTPIWIAAMFAMLAGCLHWRPLWSDFVNRRPADPQALPWFVQPLGLALTLVVVGYYLLETRGRNYSGWSLGLRWLMWLTPVWLTCLIPAADWLARTRPRRWLGAALLLASIFSVHYTLWNPWRHPWLYDFFMELGWAGY